MKLKPYTIRELIARLQEEENQDRLIVAAKDHEGNGYRLVYGCEAGSYKDGEFGLEKLTQKDIDDGYTRDDVLKGKPAFCI